MPCHKAASLPVRQTQGLGSCQQPGWHDRGSCRLHAFATFTAAHNADLTVHRKIEIKLRLADKQAHSKLAACLEKDQQATHHQENFFFDGAKQESSSTHTILRCRFYNVDQQALLTCKVGTPTAVSTMVSLLVADTACACRASMSW